MSPPPTSTRHYLALDGLRGVAALSVVCLHITGYFQLPFAPYHAYLAVDFFFLLSGFVVAHAYDRRLRRDMDIRSFLAVRLIRLYPLVLLGVAFGTVALLVSTHFGAGTGVSVSSIFQAAAANMLFLPSPAMTYLRPWAFPTDSPLWSLSFELWINIAYACLFRYLSKVSLAAALLVGALLVGWTSLTFSGLNVGFIWTDFYLGGARVLFPFVLGVIFARLLHGHHARSPWAHLAVLPLVAVFCAPKFDDGWFDAIAVLLVFPLLLGAAAQAAPNRVVDPLWRQFGQLSYPLYALHYPFVVVFSNLARAHHLHGAAKFAAAALTLGVVLAIAALASQFYDIPVRRWLATFTSPRPAPAAAK